MEADGRPALAAKPRSACCNKRDFWVVNEAVLVLCDVGMKAALQYGTYGSS